MGNESSSDLDYSQPASDPPDYKDEPRDDIDVEGYTEEKA